MINHSTKIKYGILSTFNSTAAVDELFSNSTYDPVIDLEQIRYEEYGVVPNIIDVYICNEGKVFLECLIFRSEAGLVEYIKDKK